MYLETDTSKLEHVTDRIWVALLYKQRSRSCSFVDQLGHQHQTGTSREDQRSTLETYLHSVIDITAMTRFLIVAYLNSDM